MPGKGGHTRRFFVDKYPVRVDPDTGQVAFCYIDDAAFSGLGFATWLAQYDALLRKTEGAEVVFVSTKLTASFALARKQFEQQLRSAVGSESGRVVGLLRATEEPGSGSVSQADLLPSWTCSRSCARRSQMPRFEQKYAAWLTGAESLQADTADGVLDVSPGAFLSLFPCENWAGFEERE